MIRSLSKVHLKAWICTDSHMKRLIELQGFMIATRRLCRGFLRGVLVLLSARSLLPCAVAEVHVILDT